jgi:hypothetical protein
VNVTIELERETCWCGMPFMLPKDLRFQARNRGHTIYCPLGHSITWKETEEDRLRRERDRLKQREAMLLDENASTLARAQKAEQAKRRLEKRTAAGTCPCCQRTFSNMAQHMKRQHPEFVEGTGAKVVPIKIAAVQ